MSPFHRSGGYPFNSRVLVGMKVHRALVVLCVDMPGFFQ